MRMRFPWRTAGMPKSESVSPAIPAMIGIRPWMIGSSMKLGHGTAMRVNATGKAK